MRAPPSRSRRRSTGIMTSLTTLMTGMLFTLNGLLIAGTTGLALWLWSRERITLGAIALVTALVIRISEMSGWVINLVTSIFENVGVVQEGIETVARPHGIVDHTGARELVVSKGKIRFEAIGFDYGARRGFRVLTPRESLMACP